MIDDSLLEEVKENINEYGEWDKVDPTYENIVSWARSKGDIHNLTVDALEKDRNDSIQEAKEMSLLSKKGLVTNRLFRRKGRII